MPHINIKKQSCACCYSPDAKVECTLVLGNHTIQICRDCLIDLYNRLRETFQDSEAHYGHWVWDNKNIPPYCSLCGWRAQEIDDFIFDVNDCCPHCGAKMTIQGEHDEQR